MGVFKVGDRIHVVDSMIDGYYTVGDKGIIVRKNPRNSFLIRFDHSGETWSVLRWQVEHE